MLIFMYEKEIPRTHQGPQHVTYVVILRPVSKQLKLPLAFLGSTQTQTHITLVAQGFVYGYNYTSSFVSTLLM